jgi:predicted TIM-barrel fold metal-dependent hydrolase
MKPFLTNPVVELSADLRQSPAPRPGQGLQLSEDRCRRRRDATRGRRAAVRRAAIVDFCREQHLDFYGIDYGILTPLGSSTGNGDQNVELSIALASAANEGQLAYWTAKEPRLKPSIVVPYEDGVASAAEVRKRAANNEFKQVFLL